MEKLADYFQIKWMQHVAEKSFSSPNYAQMLNILIWHSNNEIKFVTN